MTLFGWSLLSSNTQTPSFKASLLDDPYPLLDAPSPSTLFHPSTSI